MDRGRIAVEVAELSAAHNHLAATHSVISDWRSHRSDIEGHAAWSGLQRVTDAINGFLAEWDYGFGTLEDEVDVLAAALREAVTGYTETEAAIRIGFDWGAE